MATKVIVNSTSPNRVSNKTTSVNVNVNSVGPNRVSVNNQQRSTIRTVGIIPELEYVNRLVNLTDVDATNSENNETLVYDQALNKYVIKTLPIVDGGTF
jgi:hypothetical protein